MQFSLDVSLDSDICEYCHTKIDELSKIKISKCLKDENNANVAYGDTKGKGDTKDKVANLSK